MEEPFVDIHCHLLPAVDDGAKDLATSLAMARTAVEDGIGTMLATPHQLGNYPQNRGGAIRYLTGELGKILREKNIPLSILPGGEARIDETLMPRLMAGDVLTLGDHGRHVLLELPHELYFPLEPLIDRLAAAGMVGILAHPERNAGIVRQPSLVGALVDRGCLMQVTAGSLTGSFGDASQRLAEWMLEEGLVHFLATDAHSARIRRPRLRPAFERAAAMMGLETAIDLCCRNPAAIAMGHSIPSGRRKKRRSGVFALKGRVLSDSSTGRSDTKNKRGRWLLGRHA